MKTKSGFEFEINESALDDFELFDLLAQADDGNGMAIPKVLRKMFDKETVKRLYDHLRTEKGNVPLQAINDEILDIFNVIGESNKKSKNS